MLLWNNDKTLHCLKRSIIQFSLSIPPSELVLSFLGFPKLCEPPTPHTPFLKFSDLDLKDTYTYS